MRKTKSLKSELILSMLLPVALFLVLETILSYFVTLHYVNESYDRWLLDSAKSLAQEIKIKEGNVFAELPQAALEIFRWDDQDNTYFKITTENSGIIAGDIDVPNQSKNVTDENTPIFFNDQMFGVPVRVVSLLIQNPETPDKIFVHVAETLNKRHSAMTDILLADLGPQLLLGLLSGIYLFRRITKGLQPLTELTKEISQRTPHDLSPIPENQVFWEIRVLTDTINALLLKLNTAIVTQQRFIANAAHQLRTPLAGLRLQAERAQRESNLNAMRPALVQIQHSADRVSHMITQMLALARSSPIENSYMFQPIDINELAKNICIEWAAKAIQRNIELSYESHSSPLIIVCDAVLLQELLVNLLDNAIIYNNHGGQIQVKLDNTPTPCLIIADNGPGIPAQECEKVLERFYRIPGSQGNGCGLGLSIVKEIVDLHRAKLDISANMTGGTIITVTFNKSLYQ